MTVLVKRFGENITATDQWYETPDGEKVKCGEKEINEMWFNWVSGLNAKRADTDTHAVFEFKTPVEFEIIKS